MTVNMTTYVIFISSMSAMHAAYYTMSYELLATRLEV